MSEVIRVHGFAYDKWNASENVSKFHLEPTNIFNKESAVFLSKCNKTLEYCKKFILVILHIYNNITTVISKPIYKLYN